MMKDTSKIKYYILFAAISIFGFLFIARIGGLKRLIDVGGNELFANEFSKLLLFSALVFLVLIVAIVFLVLDLKKKNEIIKKEEVNRTILTEEKSVEKVEEKTLKEIKEEEINALNALLNTKDKDEKKILNAAVELFEGVQGVYYKFSKDDNLLIGTSSFASSIMDDGRKEMSADDGILGQVVTDKKIMYLSDVPKAYTNVISGLGEAEAQSILIMPFLENNEVVGIAEIAMFSGINEDIKDVARSINRSTANT